MATSYDGTVGEAGLQTLFDTGLISQAVLNALDGNKQSYVVAGDAADIVKGTDIALFDDTTSGVVDLSSLETAVVKDLNLIVFSTDEDVTLTLDGIQFKGTVVFGGGDDILDASLDKKALEINAGAGDDSIITGTGNDSVKGGDGNDTITTGAGKDKIAGGTGDDSISAGDGNDSVSGGSGDDTISAGAGNDTVNAGAGNDSVDAGAGNDTIYSGGGNDTLNADDGNDLVVITGNGGITSVDGGLGNDKLDLSYADDIIGGSVDGDTVTINLNDGTTLTVTGVETFIGDFNQDGEIDTVKLVGLDAFFTG